MTAAAPGIVVQARMGSTRLPGKVLLPLQGGTLLSHLLDRLGRCRRARKIVVATTELDEDRAVVKAAGVAGVPVFRGSETDLLDRTWGAAAAFGLDPVVRITSDCPLADPAVIDQALAAYETGAARGRVEILTNTRQGRRTFPRGLDVEVIRAALLEEGNRTIPPDAPEREHVTQWFYRNPSGLAIEDLLHEPDLSGHRWTVDTAEDLELVREIYAALHPADPAFGLAEVLELLKHRPELSEINAHIRQKKT